MGSFNSRVSLYIQFAQISLSLFSPNLMYTLSDPGLPGLGSSHQLLQLPLLLVHQLQTPVMADCQVGHRTSISTSHGSLGRRVDVLKEQRCVKTTSQCVYTSLNENVWASVHRKFWGRTFLRLWKKYLQSPKKLFEFIKIIVRCFIPWNFTVN